ncbi:hypothetical protein CEXT_641971 [Caerostris extrusa]|uniref:Uncharacterized protein n=1 Tax=Caerostris extrusa TaxID=172846 RepID=A0AAV4Q8D8_CAEEX|nr:hypothetical protein CEXT_641971 [Caerostris extrusa]
MNTRGEITRQLFMQWIHPAPPNVRRNTLSWTVRKTGNRVGKENQKKTLLNFLSPRRSAIVKWLTFSAFTPEIKGLQQSMPFLEKNVQKPDIGLDKNP